MKFFRSFEKLPGQAALPVILRMLLQEEFALVERFLRPQPELARTYPKLGNARSLLPYEVVSHGPDDHEAICPETREVVRLETSDITVYEVNRNTLFRAIAQALHIEGSWEPILKDTFRLGVNGADRIPVILSMSRNLRQVVCELTCLIDGEFVLVTPTAEQHTPIIKELLKRHSSTFISLADCIELDASGRLVPTGQFEKALAWISNSNHSSAGINTFRRCGDWWELAFAGKAVHVNHLLGLDYIAATLSKPDHALDTMRLHADLTGIAAVAANGSRGETLDSKALRRYERRILELQEDIAEAEAFHDPGRHEKLSHELDTLINEVARSQNLRGRVREDSDCERVRKKVTNAISRAIKKISEMHPKLAAHLDAHLDRGIQLCYRPSAPVRWITWSDS